MRIVALHSYLLWPYATGGERTTLEILDEFRRAGHDAVIRYAVPPGLPSHALSTLWGVVARMGFPVLSQSPTSLDYVVEGATVQTRAVRGAPSSWLGTWLDELSPDVVVVQAKDLLLLPGLVAFWRGKGFVLFQEVEATRTASTHLSPQARDRLHARLLPVATSRFLQEVARHGGFETTVLYPAWRPLPQAPPNPGGPFLSFGTTQAKGISTVLRLARAFPKRRFAVVLGWNDPPQEGPPNVEWVPFTADPLPWYHASSVVLVPSACEEGFGRVAREAMACGRVPMVSARGALPEVVGSAGIVVPDAPGPDAWVERLAHLLHEPKWEDLARACADRAAQLAALAIAQFRGLFGFEPPSALDGRQGRTDLKNST